MLDFSMCDTGGMDDLLGSSLRLLVALIIGGLIGLNRDVYGKPTGVCLHALVALGAALFTMTGSELADPTAKGRIVQGIVGGVGFLGAGVILHQHAGTAVLGLVTAASVWMTAALGVACGQGSWKLVVLAAAATLLVLGAGGPLDRALYRRLAERSDEEREPHR
jgi:putative Mg2+ transporter-C (MgtC) family protein